ncbi:MAG TPA: LysM peptidoglycan-binding domain-containing protein [Streptosporangiaceae bacterium]
MSAMHAMALPEDDPDRQAAAICRFHGRTVRGRAARGPAPVSETARAAAPAGITTPASQAMTRRATAGTPVRGQAPATGTARGRTDSSQPAASRAASSQAARGHTPRNQTTATAAPLRLTRRGRAVIAAAAALLVVMASLIAASAAQATSHSVPPRVAEQNLSRVVVRPGQTLWSVAESADPGADTRLVIQQIAELNGLTSDVVLAGQRLWVPRG